VTLDESAESSPRKEDYGHCQNTKCQVEGRWCNCAHVIPSLDDGAGALLFTIGSDASDSQTDNCAQDAPFMTIRKSNTTFNTDASESERSYFEWPGIDLEEDVGVGEVFATAPSSPVDDEFVDCFNKPIFLNGYKKYA